LSATGTTKMSKFASAQITPAKPQDSPLVRQLVRAAYAQWIPVIGREPLPMQADYDRAIREHDIDLLHVDGKLVALIETIGAADHLFIENVAVAPAHQGQGLGRRLLSHADDKARKAGLPEIRLLTNAAFAANVRLYQSVGFRIDREEPFRDGGTTVYMNKAIALNLRP
jgi:ribosomal protein S18 acetylase RimI-like enzyme